MRMEKSSPVLRASKGVLCDFATLSELDVELFRIKISYTVLLLRKLK
jgi:hypothetical protein